MSRKHNSISVVKGISVLLFGALALTACGPSQPASVISTLAVATATVITPLPSATITPTEPDETDTPEPTTPTPIPSATQAPTAQTTIIPGTLTPVPTFSPKSAQNMLVGAFQRLKTAYPFRLTEHTVGGTNIDRTTDYAAADRTHTTWTISPLPGLTENTRIGDSVYSKVNGQWSKPGPATGGNGPLDLTALLAPGLSNVQYLGQDTVNGVECFVFSFKLSISLDKTAVSGNGKVWVGIADALPHQADAALTANGVAMNTHLVYSYGVDFDIQPPN